MSFVADTIPALEIVREQAAPEDRPTRLLCARYYMYGLPIALLDFFRLAGPPCAGFERTVGLDRRRILFHCTQSLLFSLAVLAALLLFYFAAPADSRVALVVVQLVVFVKVAVVNVWIARRYFGRRARELRIPVIAPIAEAVTDRLVPWDKLHDQNAVYFAGDRPFVGYGSEVNQWTIVIDTRVTSKNPFASVPPSPVGPDAPAELYAAVEDKARTLGHFGISTERLICIDGRSVGENPDWPRWGRPEPALSESDVNRLDQLGDQARRYVLISGASRRRDVLVTQFVRFSKTGHLIFCEFASYLVPPIGRGVERLDVLFGYNAVVYALLGIVTYLGIGLLATVVGPVVEGLLWLGPFAFVTHLGTVFNESFPQYLIEQMLGGWFAYRIIGCAFVFFALVMLWQALRRLGRMVLLGLALKTNYGILLSYRERWSTIGQLRYFELQEAVRLLKIHEQVLLSSVIEWLDAHGIDTSAFKDTVSAFINQGVINSGQIGGNVATKVGSIVFRRAPRSRPRRKAAAAA